MDVNKSINEDIALQLSKYLLSFHLVLHLPYYLFFILPNINIYWPNDLEPLYALIVSSHWIFNLLGLVMLRRSYKTTFIKQLNTGFIFLIIHALLFIAFIIYMIGILEALSESSVPAFGLFIYTALLILWDIITLPLVIIIAFKIRKYVLFKQVKPENT